VFATGLSNGAFMANRLGCDLSEKIAAISPVAGTLGTQVRCSPELPVAVMAVHGTDDPLVPFAGGQMRGRGGTSTILSVGQVVDLWRGINGCLPDGTERTLPGNGEDMTVTMTSWDGCDRGTAIVLYTVNGGGHAWPGGAQYLPERTIGRTTAQFQASEASWEFFRSHPRR
jgi:polyhydroxybutyrate depolymerase